MLGVSSEAKHKTFKRVFSYDKLRYQLDRNKTSQIAEKLRKRKCFSKYLLGFYYFWVCILSLNFEKNIISKKAYKHHVKMMSYQRDDLIMQFFINFHKFIKFIEGTTHLQKISFVLSFEKRTNVFIKNY